VVVDAWWKIWGNGCAMACIAWPSVEHAQCTITCKIISHPCIQPTSPPPTQWPAMHPINQHFDRSVTDHTFAFDRPQRIYVHATLYDAFLPKFAALVQAYKLGDPADPSTTLGPVVSVASAEKIRKQVEDAVRRGAKKWVDEGAFGVAKA
jgi:hypothetical protein